jgi:endonuclease YncB( thermonuclease family)
MLAAVAAVAQWRGRVAGVHDGDTLTVLRGKTQVKVRLDGIDCPENGQAFGAKAQEKTSELAFGRVVEVRETGRDRYGRTLARIVLPEGRVLNDELVRAGLAWWYRQYAPKDRRLEALEEEARDAGRGLWADAEPVAPWLWRKERKHATAAGR